MDVSARPGNLKHFVGDTRQISTDAGTAVTDRRASWDAFAAAPNAYGPQDTGTLGEALPELLRRWTAHEDFVELVQHAFEDADDAAGPGVVTTTDVAIDEAMAREAEARGLDLSALTTDQPPITVTDPAIAPVPSTSGFTEDPVCTATGHFVEIELDLVMPARLAALSWRRVYSSRLAVTGGHGRGWGCWASARCASTADGDLDYEGPDGQLVTFPGDGRGGWRRTPWVLAEVRAADPTEAVGGVAMVWDGISERPGERWVFAADGSLLTATAPGRGTTTFERRDDRLVALRHDSGRAVEIEWEGERITALVSSCGRRVAYRYDDAGDLVAVDKAWAPYRYDLDPTGRIEAVWDADGVRLCHNTYDDDGRVLRQVSPFGRETLFSYQPGRVTVVSDTEDGPVSQWKHDEHGRLVTLTNDAGDRLLRSFDERGRCVAVTGFDGTTVTNRFDGDGRVVAARRTGRDEERFERDALGRVRRHDRPDGSWIELEYPDDGPFPSRMVGPEGWELRVDVVDGLVRGVVDADGVSIAVDVAPDGTVRATTDGLGATTRTEAHASGELSRLTLPDGHAFTVDRDDAGRPLRLTTPTGDEVVLRWTPAGRLAEIVQADGSTTAIEYAGHGAEARIIDALGRACELHHDHLERIAGLTTTDGRKWEWSHTAMGSVSAEHGPTGATWLFDHDREGRRTGVTDPSGARTAYRYDAIGRLSAMTDPTGAVTRFEHDEQSRLAAVVDPEGGTTTYRYDGWGRLTALLDPDGGATLIRYTPGGRLAEVQSAEGRGRRYVYDAAGRPVEVHQLGGGITRYQWDVAGRLTAATTPAGRTTRQHHDPLGRVVAVETAGLSWHVTYDHAGRITSRTDPLGATARFRYDAVGKLVAATDPLGRTTRYEWDDRNVCVRVVDPVGGASGYEYDAGRRRIADTDQLGHTTRYGRDVTGRIVRRDLPTGERVDYRRDRAGRILDLRIDGRAVLVQELDRCGHPTVVHEPGPNRTHVLSWTPGGRLRQLDTDGAVLEWQYDPDGFVVGRDADGHRTRYQYDAQGRLAATHDAVAGTVEVTHDGDGLVTALRAPGVDRRYRYDDAGRLVSQRERRGRKRATEVRFERDGAGRVTATDDGTSAWRYGYDAAGQLVAASTDGAAWTFAYDAAGRLVDEVRPDGARHLRYDAAHRLVAVDGVGAATFTNDELGRRTSRRDADGEVRYEWDGQGRLASVEHDGRRRVLDVDAFGSLVGVDDVALRWDPTTAVSELLAVGDGRRVGVAGLLGGEVTGDDVVWFGGDWRGSPGATDPWGLTTDAVADADLDAGADARVDRSAGAGPGFRGELALDGLVWLRNRAYDPDTRRFLSPDLLPGLSGSAFVANPFHYAGNDPIGALDPLGLEPVSLEQYQQYRREDTGPQWENIIAAAAMVGAVVLAVAVPGAGPLVLAAYGAGTAFATEVVGKQILDQGRGVGDIDWGAATKATAFGFVAGGAGGLAQGPGAALIASRLPAGMSPVTASVTSQIVAQVPTAAVVSTGQEVYDVAGGPGGDGSFDPENIIRDTVYSVPVAVADGLVDVDVPRPDPIPDIVPPVPASTATGPSGLVVPEPPPGFTPHPSGIYVPQSPSALVLPQPPAGMVPHPSGLYVPPGASTPITAPSASNGLVLPNSSFATTS